RELESRDFARSWRHPQFNKPFCLVTAALISHLHSPRYFVVPAPHPIRCFSFELSIHLMIAMTIRASLAQDGPEWLRMRSALWPDCSLERHLLEMQQLTVAGSSAVVLVAVRENGALCGFAEVAIRHDHVDGSFSVPVAYLEGWYVDPDLREQGIGRRLLEAA